MNVQFTFLGIVTTKGIKKLSYDPSSPYVWELQNLPTNVKWKHDKVKRSPFTF